MFKKIVLFCLVSCVPSFVNALTKSEIRNEIRLLCNDTRGTGKQRWTDAQIDQRIDQIQLDAVRKTDCIRRTNYITIVSSQSEYALPSDFQAMEEVSIYISSSYGRYHYEKIPFKSIDQLFADQENWEERTTGTPENYYVRYASFCVQIGIHPPPSVSLSGASKLKIEYVMKVTSMTSDTDTPFEGLDYLEPYHYLISWGVTAICKWDEGKQAQGDAWYSKYYNELIRMRKEIRDFTDYEGGIIAEEYNGTKHD